VADVAAEGAMIGTTAMRGLKRVFQTWGPLSRRLRPALGESGSVAVQFALLALPLCVLSFGLLDVNRATVAKQQLQDSLDAATLLAARSTATTDTGLAAVGDPALSANMANIPGATLSTSTFHLNGAYIDSSATVSLTPIVSNLWMQGNITVTATSEVVRTMNNVEVALVLDNTGSMGNTLGSSSTTKIAALKTAATSMVTQLQTAAQNAAQPNAVKLALVPYTMTVNVGPTYQNASWISPGLPAAYGSDIFSVAGTNRFTLFSQLGQTWGGCVESRPSPYDVTEGPPTVATPATLYVPFFAPDEPGTSAGTSWNGSSWYNNYLNDGTSSTSWSTRQANVAKYNTHTFLSTGTNGVGYQYGPNSGCAIQPLIRLTTNFTSIQNGINAMTTGGDTDITIGLQWGWHAVSPNAPFSDGVAYGTANHDKIIVLMTDGEQNNATPNNSNGSFYSGIGYIWQNRLGITSGTTAQKNAVMTSKLSQECANVKAAGIILYVVVLSDPPNDQSAVEACASSSDKLYIVTDTSQLTGVFNAIAGSITNLRLSK
jgi:Flp pilus assembly protein TadG